MKIKLILLTITLLLITGCVSSNSETEIEGVFEVEKVDQTTPTFNLFFSKEISPINLTTNLTLGQETFNITSNVAPQIGNLICLKDEDGNSISQTEIEAVTSLGGNLFSVTLHAPLEFSYSTNDGCSLRDANMAVDGSVTPQEFIISPLGLNSSVSWQVTRMICDALGDGDGASNDKPDGTSLLTQTGGTDGFYVRAENTNRANNLLHVKNNAEIKGSMYDLDILDANRGGEYEVTFRFTWNGDDKHGSTIQLSADNTSTDYHKMIFAITTDLTDVTSFKCRLQGHETDDYFNLLNS